MPQVSFYHLSKTNLEEALPKLLEKVLDSDGRAVVICENDSRVKLIDDLLWSVGGTRLIPHGTANDNFPELQPVFVTEKQENPNDANFLVSFNSRDEGFYKSFQRTLVVFSGSSEAELNDARGLWKKLKSDSAYELKYFLQNEKGLWEEKKN